MPHRIRNPLAALALAVAAAATASLPAPAYAGQYTIDQCTDPATGAPKRVAAEWAGAGEARKYVACGGSGGSFGLELPGAGARIGYDRFVWLSLTAPPDVEIDRARLWYRVRPHEGNRAYFEVYAGGTRHHSEEVPTDHSGVPLDVPLPAGGRSIDLALYCSTAYGGIDCSWGSAFEVLRIAAVRLTLREGGLPALTVDGGSLVAGGERAGTETIAYSASDAGAGVERVRVKLGATVVAERDLRADPAACPRDTWAACARARSEELTVDTRRVPDGAHQLTLVVTDAAGNSRVVDRGVVQVRNQPPSAPPAQAGTPQAPADGAGGGAASSRDARLTAVFESSRTSAAHIRYGRTAAIVGQLTDGRGRPIPGAALDVTTTVARAGEQPAPDISPRTDANGLFRHVVAAGPSRLVRVSYRPADGDAAPAASVDLSAHVGAAVSLRASPARLRNGRVMTLAGRLPGRPLPLRGVVVDLQARIAGRWRSFAVVRSTRTGRFRHRHRFRHVRRPADFRFRARVRRDASYPYTSGRSRVVRVRVRP